MGPSRGSMFSSCFLYISKASQDPGPPRSLAQPRSPASPGAQPAQEPSPARSPAQENKRSSQRCPRSPRLTEQLPSEGPAEVAKPQFHKDHAETTPRRRELERRTRSPRRMRSLTCSTSAPWSQSSTSGTRPWVFGSPVSAPHKAGR